MQTVNLSKLQAQHRNITASQKVTAFSGLQGNENNIRYTVQPAQFLRSASECNKPVVQGYGSHMIISPIEPIRKTFSA